MKKYIMVSESLSDYKKQRELSQEEREDIEMENVDKFYSVDPEDMIEPEQEDLEPMDKEYIDDEDQPLVKKIEDFNYNKQLMQHIKSIITNNKAKPDKKKDYLTFKIMGKPELINGIPVEIRGNKENTTILFARRAKDGNIAGVKIVPFQQLILESIQRVNEEITPYATRPVMHLGPSFDESEEADDINIVGYDTKEIEDWVEDHYDEYYNNEEVVTTQQIYDMTDNVMDLFVISNKYRENISSIIASKCEQIAQY